MRKYNYPTVIDQLKAEMKEAEASLALYLNCQKNSIGSTWQQIEQSIANLKNKIDFYQEEIKTLTHVQNKKIILDSLKDNWMW